MFVIGRIKSCQNNNFGWSRCWKFRRINTLRPRQYGRHFADDLCKYILLNEDLWIPIKISLKFGPKGSINNIPALVQKVAWRPPCDKPLSEPMVVCLPVHIYALFGLNELTLLPSDYYTLLWDRLLNKWSGFFNKTPFFTKMKLYDYIKSHLHRTDRWWDGVFSKSDFFIKVN